MSHDLNLLQALVLSLSALTMASPTQHGRDGLGPGPRKKPINDRSAAEVITALNLVPNVEAGYFIETFRDEFSTDTATNRSASTAIYYLLEGKLGWSAWHKVDAAEVWHYYAGAPLTLSLSTNDGTGTRNVVLGQEIFNGEKPQIAVQRGEWQRARSAGKWTLVGTTVAPGFVEGGFELAPPEWVPN
ncbi:RmlC-like cupin domain-containing protein [Triangularia verruculosa]|uniref:RmlC-like cupin domain-containing protein n=1 Tax=Triangularia verruculosa TaxID=2587418 RepID=A0AAN7AUY0_9PEZI|nr:RmlC-like cupin domain-containing protein [Triangularia verruculosa]